MDQDKLGNARAQLRPDYVRPVRKVVKARGKASLAATGVLTSREATAAYGMMHNWVVLCAQRGAHLCMLKLCP